MESWYDVNPISQGRACTTCVKAKAKCIPLGPGRWGCERCERLKRHCAPSPAARKRGPNRLPKASAQVNRLEQKVDSLVSLLKENPRALAWDSSSGRSGDFQSPVSPVAVTPGSSIAGGALHAEAARRNDDSCDAAAHIVEFNSSMLSLDDMDDCLEIFRSRMLSQFPLVAIPDGMPGHVLKTESPFLWLCIMALTQKSTPKQTALGLEIRRTMGHRILVQGERNLDLLLGLLVCSTWCKLYVKSKPIITQVIQLAISLLADLDFNTPVPKEPYDAAYGNELRSCTQPASSIQERTFAERRAALTCFSISQMISLYFSRTEPLKWTPYLEECRRILSTAEAAPGDRLLTCMIQVQLVVMRSYEAPWHNELAHDYSPRAPTIFYVNALDTQLRGVKESLPADMRDNDDLSLCIHNASVLISEAALQKSPLSSELPDLQRLELLWSCLQAVRQWFEIFLRFETARYIGVPIAVHTSFVHCIIVLFKLSTFEYPGWDLKLVKETCNLSTILHETIEMLQKVKSAAGLDPDTQEDISLFSAAGKRLAALRRRYETSIDTRTDMDTSTTASATVDASLGTTEADNEIPWSMMDETWLRDILSSDQFDFDEVVAS